MERHTPADTPLPKDRSSRQALAALYFATVAAYGDMYITQPILPILGREFVIAPATAGLTVFVVVLAIAAASLLYGPLSDTLGRKPVMVWSSACLAVPTLLCAFAPNFATLLLFRTLQGLLIPGLTAVAVAYLGDQFNGVDLGAAVGNYIGASVAGGLAGRVLGGLIADLIHWRAAFVAFALLTLLGAWLMARALPVAVTSERARWSSAYGSMVLHVRNRRLVGAFVVGASLFFAFIGVFTYLPYYLTAPPFNLPTSVVSSVYAVYLAGVFISPVIGRLSVMVSRRAIMAGGMAIAGIGMLGTLTHWLPVILVSLVIVCGGNFMAQSTTPAFVNANARAAKGGASALYLTSFYVGGAAGSILPGYAWQLWGWSGVITACLTAVVIGLVANWTLCR